MAVGNNVGMTPAQINANAAALAQNLYSQYQYWLKQYAQWNQNLGNASQLTAAGITLVADQNLILALILDLARLISTFQGVAPSNQSVMTGDCMSVLGIA